MRRSLSVAVIAPLGRRGRGSASPMPLPQRVLHAGDFMGLKPVGAPRVTSNATDWSDTFALPATPTSLKQDGFVAGLGERLHWQANDIDGLSVTTQLNSDLARASMQQHLLGRPVRPTAVPRIRHPRGDRLRLDRRQPGRHQRRLHGRRLCLPRWRGLGPKLEASADEGAARRDRPAAVPPRPRPPRRVGNGGGKRRGNRLSPLDSAMSRPPRPVKRAAICSGVIPTHWRSRALSRP